MELYVVRENDKIIALFTNEQRAKFYCRENLANLHYQKETWIRKGAVDDVMSEKREDNRFILTDDGVFDKVLMKTYPRALNETRKCKYCKHLLVNLDSSTIQTCWLSHDFVDVEGACEKFEFSQKRYDGYNKYSKSYK